MHIRSNDYIPRLYCVECRTLLSDLTCPNCGKIYRIIDGIPSLLNTKDTQSELFQRYSDNYSQIASDDIIHDIMPGYYKEAQADKILSYCGDIQGNRVLDIGAGKGILLDKIEGVSKVAVDISPEYLRLLASRGIASYQANAENLPFENEFDVIFLTDILEHVLNVENAVTSARRALKVGGLMVVRVPFEEDISVYSESKYEFVHLRSFDKKSLISLLESSGLKVEKVHFDGFVPYKANFAGMMILVVISKEYRGTTFPMPFPVAGAILNRLHIPGISEISPHIARLPNWIGNLLIQPMELAVSARRVE